MADRGYRSVEVTITNDTRGDLTIQAGDPLLMRTWRIIPDENMRSVLELGKGAKICIGGGLFWGFSFQLGSGTWLHIR